MNENKANHRVNVVRLSEPATHTNADTLELFIIDDYQVVVKKGQFKAGELAIYIQPDSVVPKSEAFRFIWEGHVGLDGVVPEKRRRITVRKFRGEWSEGLLMPLADFVYQLPKEITKIATESEYGVVRLTCKEGDDVAAILGITHYEPPTEPQETAGQTSSAPRHRYPRTLKGWFFFLLHKLGVVGGHKSFAMEVAFDAPCYDVESLKNHKSTFEDGEFVFVTEKIHGSNARYLFLDGTMYAGSHYQWKSPESTCVFRRALKELPWIEEWCRANEGCVLYGEVTPTQKGYDYGSKNVQFFVFTMRTPDGKWSKLLGINGHEGAPLLYSGPFNLELVKYLADGYSTVTGAKHVREGVVVTPAVERSVRGLGRVELKLVSNSFLEKDSK